MFSIKDFIEIQVIGFLLLLGVLPLIILFNPSLRNKDGFFAQLDEISDKTTKAVFLIVLAFSLGVAANRIFDDALDPLGIDPGSQYKTDFKTWAESNKSNVTSLKKAELALSERSEVERGWLERHKLFDRIDRGAFISFILLLVSMAVYEATKKRFEVTKPRYSLRHFVVAFLLASVFFLAYWLESSSYKEHIYDSYTQLSVSGAQNK
jgi:hypothetical protein